MPRVELLWDRVYILKIICTVQMTFASFVTILYVYLIILQSWTLIEETRQDIIRYKWCVLTVTMLDFGLGTLLALAANMTGIRCRRRIVAWILLESVNIPLCIFLLMRLFYKITSATETLVTDVHYARINATQVCFLLCHYFFIAYAMDFLVSYKPKLKSYDPSIRPESIYETTDPQITTTESRHIRMSQSFLSQPSTSKGFQKNAEREESIDNDG